MYKSLYALYESGKRQYKDSHICEIIEETTDKLSTLAVDSYDVIAGAAYELIMKDECSAVNRLIDDNHTMWVAFHTDISVSKIMLHMYTYDMLRPVMLKSFNIWLWDPRSLIMFKMVDIPSLLCSMMYLPDFAGYDTSNCMRSLFDILMQHTIYGELYVNAYNRPHIFKVIEKDGEFGCVFHIPGCICDYTVAISENGDLAIREHVSDFYRKQDVPFDVRLQARIMLKNLSILAGISSIHRDMLSIVVIRLGPYFIDVIDVDILKFTLMSAMVNNLTNFMDPFEPWSFKVKSRNEDKARFIIRSLFAKRDPLRHKNGLDLIGIEPNPGPPEEWRFPFHDSEVNDPDYDRDVEDRLNKIRDKKINDDLKEKIREHWRSQKLQKMITETIIVKGGLLKITDDQFRAMKRMEKFPKKYNNNQGRGDHYIDWDYVPEMGYNFLGMEHTVVLKDEQAQVLKEISSAVTSLVDTVTNVDGATTNEKIRILAEQGGAAAGKAAASALGGSILDKVKEIAKTFFGDDLRAAYTVFCTAVGVYLYTSKASSLVCISAGVALLATGEYMFVEKGFVENIMSAFRKLMARTGEGGYAKDTTQEFEAQAGVTHEVLVEGVKAMMLMTLFPRTNFDVKTLVRFFSDFGSVSRNAEEVVSALVKLLQKAADHVSRMLGYESFELVASSNVKVQEWVTRSRKILRSLTRDDVDKDKLLYSELCELDDLYFNIITQFYGTKELNSVGMYMRPLHLEICNCRRQLEEAGICSSKWRIPPIILLLAGISQIGKSRLLRILANALIAASGDPVMIARAARDFDSIVYSRQNETEYWDAYVGQPICYFDEFNIVPKKLLKADNAQMDMVRCGNPFPNVLHMAQLEKKGSMYFRSRYIIATTNTFDVCKGSDGAVSHPEAVVNRIHFNVDVLIDEAYATEESKRISKDPKFWRLDYSKLEKDGKFTFDVHNFRIKTRKLVEGSPGQTEQVEGGEIVNLEEFVRRVTLKYREIEINAASAKDDDVLGAQFGTRILKDLKREEELDRIASESGDKCTMPPTDADSLEGTAIGTKIHDENLRKSQSEPDGFKPQMGLKSGPIEQEIMFGNSPHRLSVLLARLENIVPGCSRKTLREYAEECDDKEQFLKLCEKYGDLFDAYCHGLGEPCFKEYLPNILNDERYYLERVTSGQTAVVYLRNMKKHLNKVLDPLDRFLNRAQVFLAECYFKLCKFFSAISFESLVKLFAGAAVLTYAFSLAYSLWGGSKSKSEDYSIVQVDEVEKDVKPQMRDPALGDIYTKSWEKNWYSMHENGSRIGYGFFIKDQIFAIPSHFLDVWRSRKSEANIEITSKYGRPMSINVNFFLEKCKPTGCVDLSYCNIPSARMHGSILKYVIDAKDLIAKSSGDCLLVRATAEGRSETWTRFTMRNDIQYESVDGIIIKHADVVSYKATTGKGDCGAPLFIVDPTTRDKKLIGVHVAGSTNTDTGLATLLHNLCSNDFEIQIGPSSAVKSHQVIGQVRRGTGSTGKSRIMKSALYEAWGPALKAPAKLKPFYNEDGERIFPMEEALKRYDKPILVYDPALVRVCARAAVSNVHTAMLANNCKLTKISMEDAILGIPGKPFYDSINRATSPGYPWNLTPRPGYSGKERFFGKEADITFTGPDWPELKKEICEAEDMLKRGIRPMFVFADALKDELVSKEKASIGKTRLFCPCPVVYQVLFMMYFKSFFAGMMESRIECESTIGINVYSEEWELLHRKLTRFGKLFNIAGDFKTFDADQAAQILEEIGQQVKETFLDREWDGVRELLWKEVHNSVHLQGLLLVLWTQSLPSGHPGTSPINCLFGGTIFRMAWVNANGGNLMAVISFEDNVVLRVYGDDNMLNVSALYRVIFNQHTLTELLAQLGMTYTGELKGDLPPPFRPIEECEFLKRTWRYEPRLGRHVAPLRMASILEMPYWTKCDMVDEITRTNVDTALRELSLHPPEVFDVWAPKILKATSEKLGYVPIVVDRDTLLDHTTKMDKYY